MKVTILGCGSSTPSKWRNPSSQLLEIGDETMMIDCGEGTVLRLLKLDFKHQKISTIFISHLHGDHYWGLIGLISAMNSSYRVSKLKIFGPFGLKIILSDLLKISKTKLQFEIDLVEIEHKASTLLSTPNFQIATFPLVHRLPCNGFIFSEFESSSTDALPKKYGYCSDTLFLADAQEFPQNLDLLYHEATFEQKMQEWAKKTFHSTSLDAANAAKNSLAKKMILGHFSSRYQGVDFIIEEARTIFKETYEAIEGTTYSV